MAMEFTKHDIDEAHKIFLEEFKTWRDKTNTQISNSLGNIINGRPSELLFISLLKAAFDTSLAINFSFGKHIAALSLYKKFEDSFDKAFRIVCNSESDSYYKTTKSLFQRLCFAVQTSSNSDLYEGFLLDDDEKYWQLLNVVYSDKRYFVFNTPFLILMKCIDLINGWKVYDEALAIMMRTKIYDKSRGVKGLYTNINNKYPEWNRLFEDWIESQLIKCTGNFKNAYRHFIAYIDLYRYSSEPRTFLKSKREVGFIEYLKDTNTKAINSFGVMHSFTSWIIDELMDGDGIYIATQSQIKSFVTGNSESSLKPSESTKEVMPSAWVRKCKEILTENDHAWPKSLTWQYFKRFNPETGSKESIWSPSTTYLYLLMLELPIRKIQAQQLDSGEGDVERYNLETLKWEKNTHSCSGYWRDLKSKKISRGVITKLLPEGKPVPGIYINTNKTADIKKGFGEDSGYTIPWDNHEVFKIVNFMRDWNDQFNPVSAPLPFEDAPSSCWSFSPTESVIKKIPPRFYLFRNPCGKHPEAPASEANVFKFWRFLMAELEKRLNEEGQDVLIVLTYDQQNNPSSTFFTPHGLRTTGLTALAQKGVPIEILSKLIAGHASVFMTFHYIKHAPEYITEILNEAQYKITLEDQTKFTKQLKNSTANEARKFAVANSEEALNFHHKNYESGSKTNYTGSSIGLCPHNGTACDTGGPMIRKNGGKKLPEYGPVEGGARNCVNCRYLISGTPWLINLVIEINKKFVLSHTLSVEINELRNLITSQASKRYKLQNDPTTQDEVRHLNREIQGLENTLETKSNQLDSIFMTCHAYHNLIEKVRAMTNEADSNQGYSLLMQNNNESPIEYNVTSRLETLNLVMQAGSLWKDKQDVDIERERTMFIDKVLFEAGMTPISYSKLTDEEKKIAVDHASKFLVTSLSRDELIQVENNHLTLDKLGLCKAIENTIRLIEPVQENNTQVIKFIRKA